MLNNKGIRLSVNSKPQNAKELALLCADTAHDKLAENIVVMDLTGIEQAPADFFVLCTCNSDIHVRAVTDAILEKCVFYSMAKPRREGTEYKEWVLLDFFDVVTHLMLEEKRSFYQLEKLWGDAEFWMISEEGTLLSMENEDLKHMYA